MRLFAPENRTRSRRNSELYATCELIYTAVDFAAAILFLIGSICFTLKPSLKLIRELHYLSIGDIDDLAARAQK